MPHRRKVWLRVSFACTLISVAASSCTPDERNLGLGRSAAERNDASAGSSVAGTDELAGSAGSLGEESAAGDSGAAGATISGSGGANPSSGGVGGTSTGTSAGSGGTGGTSATRGGAGGAGGATHGGNAGAPFIGPCGDMDGNAVDDCSETLVQNSRFDSNVDHWVAGAWNASNSSPTSPSGSLLVLNDSPVQSEAGYRLTAAEQCVQVTGDFEYQVAARVMIPAGQGGGFAGINLWIFANDECKGTFVTGLSPASTQETNAWTVVSAQFRMPTAARSMSVRLAAMRPFAQQKLQVLFDDVLVKQKLP
jgi:hypothetical protein